MIRRTKTYYEKVNNGKNGGNRINSKTSCNNLKENIKPERKLNNSRRERSKGDWYRSN